MSKARAIYRSSGSLRGNGIVIDMAEAADIIRKKKARGAYDGRSYKAHRNGEKNRVKQKQAMSIFIFINLLLAVFLYLYLPNVTPYDYYNGSYSALFKVAIVQIVLIVFVNFYLKNLWRKK